MSDQFGQYLDDESFSIDLQIFGDGFLLGAHAAGTFPTPGYVISLIFGNQGINPDPAVVLLTVHEEQLEGGWPDVITTVKGSAEFNLANNPHQVLFNLPDGTTIHRRFEAPSTP